MPLYRGGFDLQWLNADLIARSGAFSLCTIDRRIRGREAKCYGPEVSSDRCHRGSSPTWPVPVVMCFSLSQMPSGRSLLRAEMLVLSKKKLPFVLLSIEGSCLLPSAAVGAETWPLLELSPCSRLRWDRGSEPVPVADGVGVLPAITATPPRFSTDALRRTSPVGPLKPSPST